MAESTADDRRAERITRFKNWLERVRAELARVERATSKGGGMPDREVQRGSEERVP